MKALLASPRIPALAAVLATLLTATSLSSGLATEDLLFRVAAQRELSLANVNLYDAEEVAGGVDAARRVGTLPWLTPESFHISFWRPLASLTHWIDYRLLPGPAWRLHLESLLVYALLAVAAALLYRRTLAPPWIAGIAALLYAVDDAHGPAVGWLANRHAVLGAALGTLALWLHDRWRREGARASGVLSVVALGLALASSELAIAALLYVVAHALTLDPARGPRRLLAIAPAALVSGVWFWRMRALGHGSSGSGTYLDPAREPLLFLAALPERLGTLLLGQLAAPPADTWHVVGGSARALMALGGFAAAAALAWALAPRWRSSAAARFFALGAALSLLPCAATFPSDRLLYFAGLGGSALVALVLGELVAGARRLGVALLAPPLALLHAGVAPVLLPFRTLRMTEIHRDMIRASDSAYAQVRAKDERLIAVNSPDYYFCKMLRELRWTRGHPDAPPLLCLAGTLAPVRVTRLDPNALEVRPQRGFLDAPFNRTYRSRSQPMSVGESVFVGTAQVVVTAVDDGGAPTAAQFRFIYPLESDKLRFVVWDGGEYRAWTPPPPGAAVVISP